MLIRGRYGKPPSGIAQVRPVSMPAYWRLEKAALQHSECKAHYHTCPHEAAMASYGPPARSARDTGKAALRAAGPRSTVGQVSTPAVGGACRKRPYGAASPRSAVIFVGQVSLPANTWRLWRHTARPRATRGIRAKPPYSVAGPRDICCRAGFATCQCAAAIKAALLRSQSHMAHMTFDNSPA